MIPPTRIAGFTDALLAILLAAGCLLCLPVYWWLVVSPLLRLFKRTRKSPQRRILWTCD
jgi:type II secretory pathway component PulM